MGVNQGDMQQSVRAVSGSSNDFNGDWHALFDQASIAAGDFNGRMLNWLNLKLSASYVSLPEAQQALANSLSVYDWSSIGTFSASISGGATYVAAYYSQRIF